MRIAFYHATLPSPARAKEGGVSYVVHRLANTLVSRGHELTVLTFDPAPDDALYGVVRLPLARWGEAVVGRMVLAPLLLARPDFSRFDVMHAHGDDHFAAHKSLPWVRTFYGSARRERDSAVRLRRRLSQTALIPLEHLSARRADIVTGISRDTALCIPGLDEIVPCGVDLTVFSPSKQPRSAAPSILFVGAMLGRKRGDLLLSLFREKIKLAIPEAELWIVAEQGAAEKGVRWCGKVSTEELATLYRQAWVFCLPSSYEGFGVPYVEALACGTPVVASPNAGAREVLDEGRFGVISRDDDLAGSLLALLRDPDARARLGASGPVRAAAFDQNVVAARYEGIYGEAIEHRARERTV